MHRICGHIMSKAFTHGVDNISMGVAMMAVRWPWVCCL